jgi:mannose-6-phosphate isomerase-like protein (cupin superfamily)
MRYSDEDGEISAVLTPASRPPDLTSPTGGSTHYLATTDRTSGEYGLYRWNMGAAPSGPDPHFHRTISEAFYVLSGTVRLYDGDHWVDAAPGDFLYVPVGGIHAFRNESGAPASMLILFAPGAPREAYFEELVDIATTGRRLSREEWTELYARHDQYMV